MRQLVLKHQLYMKDSIASQQNITSLVDISRGKLEDPRLRLGVAFVIVQLDVPLTIQRKMMSSSWIRAKLSQIDDQCHLLCCLRRYSTVAVNRAHLTVVRPWLTTWLFLSAGWASWFAWYPYQGLINGLPVFLCLLMRPMFVYSRLARRWNIP